jgi:hypothetical protein
MSSSSSSSSSSLLSLGTVWQDKQAARAWTNGALVSKSTSNNGDGDNGGALRLCFRNASTVPLFLCWVAENGSLHHFYELAPTTVFTSTSIARTSILLEDDHIEHTQDGHAFCIAYLPEDDETLLEEAKASESVPDASCIIGGFRPTTLRRQQQQRQGEEDEDDTTEPVYLVTISQRPRRELLPCLPKRQRGGKGDLLFSCCRGGGGSGRKRRPLFGVREALESRKRKTLAQAEEGDDNNSDDNAEKSKEEEEEDSDDDDCETTTTGIEWMIHVQQLTVDLTPIDTTTKEYHRTVLGGWPVYVEPDWHNGDVELEQRLAKDLKHLNKVLPKQARDYLKKNCPVWVNKSLQYGPKACPAKGVGCCYHPDVEWLEENGLHPEKAHCVEINDGLGYCDDLDLWGVGGVMVHEFSHAYHHLMLPDGYDNTEILECYTAAMKEGLYDCVAVHGTQGPECKAYACTNCMEYFAELSTAFLGGTKKGEEYNKWYPFNRQQLKEHDPRAYQLLSRLWKVKCK